MEKGQCEQLLCTVGDTMYRHGRETTFMMAFWKPACSPDLPEALRCSWQSWQAGILFVLQERPAYRWHVQRILAGCLPDNHTSSRKFFGPPILLFRVNCGVSQYPIFTSRLLSTNIIIVIQSCQLCACVHFSLWHVKNVLSFGNILASSQRKHRPACLARSHRPSQSSC